MPVKIPNTLPVAIISQNVNATPKRNLGAIGIPPFNLYYSIYQDISPVIPTGIVNQIAGLVPLFPCSTNDCRSYGADSLDPLSYVLPVFATNDLSDPYYNDTNSFLFNFIPSTLGSSFLMQLDKLINGVWTFQATLNNNTYGKYYAPGSLCSSNSWQGYTLNWLNVLNLKGEGTYRFRVNTNMYGISNFQSCYVSPGFCLKTFDCNSANGTVRFDASYSGGVIPVVDKKNCGGDTFSFCCVVQHSDVTLSSPITWNDSIRVYGFFGNEKTSYERVSLKYQTGIVKKVRDDATLKFTWESAPLPFWFHERFKIYGAFADKLLVNDYNTNNPDYSLKSYCVQMDGEYNLDKKNSSRYRQVTVDFTSEVQNLKRTRCC